MTGRLLLAVIGEPSVELDAGPSALELLKLAPPPAGRSSYVIRSVQERAGAQSTINKRKRMRERPKAYRLLVMAMMLALVAAACSAEDGTDTTAATDEPTTIAANGTETTLAGAGDEKPQIVIALSDTVNIVEPHTFRSTSAYSVTDALYEPLLAQAFEEVDGVLLGSREEHVGKGAASYEIVETDAGGLLATFELREGAMFPDGSPVTADDYKYTFDRTIVGPGYIGLLLPFIGIDSVDQIRVIDDYTLEIEAKVQSPLFERFLTFQVFGAMNQEELDANATEADEWAFEYLADKGAGAGPYVIESYNPDSEIVLVPNENYWDADAVANSGVTLRTVPDANQRALLVQSGEIDLAAGLPPQLLAELANDESVVVYSAPTTGVQYMGMNREIAPLDNVDVRKAILHAVPYQALLDQVMFGFATPANGVVTSTMETHDATIGGQYATDLDLAAQYLADSGETVSLQLAVRESRSDDQEAAVLIQDSLRQIGIEMEIAVLPDADFGERLNNGELPLFIHDWYSWGEDPFYQMQFLTTCGQFVNYARFCNEEYDALVAEGTFSLDPAVRADASTQAQQIFFDEAVWAPLWSTDRTVVAGRCVTGVDRDYTLVTGFDTLSKTEDC
jgi:peptide/nickel transport system substrate-binding protein